MNEYKIKVNIIITQSHL